MPVSGLTPTATGAVRTFVLTVVTLLVDRFTTERVLSPLFVTSAMFDKSSMATLVGLFPTAIGPPGTNAGGLCVISTNAMLFELWLTTTAIPVTGLTAAATGPVAPAGNGSDASVMTGGFSTKFGWTAKFVAARFAGAEGGVVTLGLTTVTWCNPACARICELSVTVNWRGVGEEETV